MVVKVISELKSVSRLRILQKLASVVRELLATLAARLPCSFSACTNLRIQLLCVVQCKSIKKVKELHAPWQSAWLEQQFWQCKRDPNMAPYQFMTQMHQVTPWWHWPLQARQPGQMYSLYAVLVSCSANFRSVSLYNQLLSSYRPNLTQVRRMTPPTKLKTKG